MIGLVGLRWVGLRWIGLGWFGLGWVGLDWAGLDWVGLDEDSRTGGGGLEDGRKTGREQISREVRVS